MTIPSPPASVPECGVVQSDRTVTVKLSWTPSPDVTNQDLSVWPIGVSDDIDNIVFGSSFLPEVSNVEVSGLEQGKIYFWSIITNGETSSGYSWFKTNISGPQPPQPGEGGFPVWLLLAASGVVVFLIATKKLSPEASAAAIAVPFIPP